MRAVGAVAHRDELCAAAAARHAPPLARSSRRVGVLGRPQRAQPRRQEAAVAPRQLPRQLRGERVLPLALCCDVLVERRLRRRGGPVRTRGRRRRRQLRVARARPARELVEPSELAVGPPDGHRRVVGEADGPHGHAQRRRAGEHDARVAALGREEVTESSAVEGRAALRPVLGRTLRQLLAVVGEEGERAVGGVVGRGVADGGALL
mmetsp:Transcript_32030/g.74657  ORF Transcript_32030/g.74657 Transcript_32030/m.74657 type:complete len:207 (+) Transcript_32030:491-1111(+)